MLHNEWSGAYKREHGEVSPNIEHTDTLRGGEINAVYDTNSDYILKVYKKLGNEKKYEEALIANQYLK